MSIVNLFKRSLCVAFIILASALTTSVYGGITEWEAHIKKSLADSQRGDHRDAMISARRALKEAESLGENDLRIPITLNMIGSQYMSQGDYAQAEPLFQRSLKIRQKALAADHPDVAVSLNNLAMLHMHQGKYSDAQQLIIRAIDIWEKALGRDNVDVAVSLNNLAMIHSAQGKDVQAELLLKRSVTIWENLRDANGLAVTLDNISKLYVKMGRKSEAEQVARQARNARERTQNETRQFMVRSLPR